MGDFQEVVGGWPPSLSWGPAPTWAFGLSKCILRKNRKQVIDHCPGFSSAAPKPDPCTRIAAGTGPVRHMGVGIYPAPLVFWDSCPAAPGRSPGHPLDSRGRARSWGFPACPGVGVPGRLLAQEGEGLEESTISPGVRPSLTSTRLPPSDLSRTNGHSRCNIEKNDGSR